MPDSGREPETSWLRVRHTEPRSSRLTLALSFWLFCRKWYTISVIKSTTIRCVRRPVLTVRRPISATRVPRTAATLTSVTAPPASPFSSRCRYSSLAPSLYTYSCSVIEDLVLNTSSLRLTGLLDKPRSFCAAYKLYASRIMWSHVGLRLTNMPLLLKFSNISVQHCLRLRVCL